MSKAKELYPDDSIEVMAKAAADSAKKPVYRYGIRIYIEGDPDTVGSDAYISPEDSKGVDMCREFMCDLSDHYEALTNTDKAMEISVKEKLREAAPALLKAVELALNIKDLWAPVDYTEPQHEGEAQALQQMLLSLRSAFDKATA